LAAENSLAGLKAAIEKKADWSEIDVQRTKDNKYIKSVTFNGKAYNQWYISHQELLSGGELVFEMTNK